MWVLPQAKYFYHLFLFFYFVYAWYFMNLSLTKFFLPFRLPLWLIENLRNIRDKSWFENSLIFSVIYTVCSPEAKRLKRFHHPKKILAKKNLAQPNPKKLMRGGSIKNIVFFWIFSQMMDHPQPPPITFCHLSDIYIWEQGTPSPPPPSRKKNSQNSPLFHWKSFIEQI